MSAVDGVAEKPFVSVLDFRCARENDRGQGGLAMLRFLSCLLLTVAVVAGAASTATACINDRELQNHEKEFKSNYLEQEMPAPLVAKQDKMLVMSGLGIASLFLGAVTGTIVVVRRR
jgi:hypothetical protein